MFVRRKTRPVRQPSHSVPVAKRRRGKAPLDAAGLLLELDMAALIRESESSLRQHDDSRRGLRGWWQRFFGTRYANRTA
jgi:hypothetical protein